MISSSIKNVIAAAMILCANAVSAESWEVQVTSHYVNSKSARGENVDVLTFMVPVGKCVEGITKTKYMSYITIPRTQEICVRKHKTLTIITGFVFLAKPITNDSIFELEYGSHISAAADGSEIQFKTDFYQVHAFRNMSF